VNYVIIFGKQMPRISFAKQHCYSHSWMVNKFSDVNLATVMDKSTFLPDRIYRSYNHSRLQATVFLMITVIMTCQVLKHQRKILCL